MRPNVGTIDRILRIALGLGSIAASALGFIGAGVGSDCCRSPRGSLLLSSLLAFGAEHLRHGRGQRKVLRPPMGAL